MTYVRDTMTGSQGAQLSAHTVDSGHTITEHPSQTTGAIIIDGGRARSNSTAEVTYVYGATPDSAVQIMECDVVLTAGQALSDARFATQQDPAALTGYVCGLYWDGSTVDRAVIGRRVAGATITELANVSLGTLAAATYKLRVVTMKGFQGVFLDDELVASSTDATAGIGVGQPGFYWRGSSTHYRFDNVSAKWVSSGAFTASSNAPAVPVPADAEAGDDAFAVFETIGSLKPPVPTSPGTGTWAPVQDFTSSTPNSSGMTGRVFRKRLAAGDLGQSVTSAVGGTANNVVAHIAVIPGVHATRPVTTNIWERDATADAGMSVVGNPADSAHKFDVPYAWGWELAAFAGRLAAADAGLAITPPADMTTLEATVTPDTRTAACLSILARTTGIPADVSASLSAATTQKAGVRVLVRPAASNATPIVGLRARLEFVGVPFHLQPTLGSDTVAYGTATTLDHDGDELTPAWSQVGTSPAVATIAVPASWAPEVTLSTPGDYTFQLAVTDPDGATATGTCVVTVVAQP